MTPGLASAGRPHIRTCRPGTELTHRSRRRSPEVVRRAALSLLGLFISVVAIYFVVRSVDLRQTLDTMAHAQAGLLLATLPLIAIGIILRSLRWQRLLP